MSDGTLEYRTPQDQRALLVIKAAWITSLVVGSILCTGAVLMGGLLFKVVFTTLMNAESRDSEWVAITMCPGFLFVILALVGGAFIIGALRVRGGSAVWADRVVAGAVSLIVCDVPPTFIFLLAAFNIFGGWEKFMPFLICVLVGVACIVVLILMKKANRYLRWPSTEILTKLGAKRGVR